MDTRTTRRVVLLGAVAGAVAGCSTAPVPYDANEAGQIPGDGTAPTPGTSMMATQSPAAAGGQSTGGQSAGGQSASGQPTSGQSTGGQSTGGQSAGAPSMGTVLGDVSDIPVGSGVIYTAEKVVVTQPVKGEYHAFSAVCTHVGCILNKIADGTIDCPCHGSEFKITNGAVVTGPAPTALPKKKIQIADGKVILV
jgi:Rieske Fe-S protein